MTAELLLYTGSAIIFAWGIAHIAPVASVVAGFEPLTRDNRLVLTMEWVAEGLALSFIGVLTFLTTVVVGPDAAGAALVYRASAGMLLVFAVWTAVMGGRTAAVPFKICPVVKTVVAVMLVAGSLL